MSGLRFCRDCRFRRGGWLLAPEMRCANHHVSPVFANLVTGETKQERKYCTSARQFGPCGEEGALWEQRA